MGDLGSSRVRRRMNDEGEFEDYDVEDEGNEVSATSDKAGLRGRNKEG